MGVAMERKEHHRRSVSPKREDDRSSSHRREKEKHSDQRREKMADRTEKDRSRNSDRSYDRERSRGGERSIEREKDRRDDSDRGRDRDRDRDRERPKEREERGKDVEKSRVRNSEKKREREGESPRSKRGRAQEEREAEKSEERESRKERRHEREERESRKEERHEREKNRKEERDDKRRRGSRSPAGRREKSQSRDEVREARGDSIPRSNDPDPLAQMDATAKELEAKEKQKPSFELSGKLAEETNKVRGVTLIFTEPPEARKPELRWRFYVFKGAEQLKDPLYVHRQSCYLFGRERRVADIPTDHPSCSKQHAVLQYRLVEEEQPDGMMKQIVRPYMMDLESTNGTFVNDVRIESHKYFELRELDTIKFGNSSREYVLLHENSAGGTK